MSYCRFSSGNFYCDAYVYESCDGGFVTHLASRRFPPGSPPDPFSVYMSTKSQDAYEAASDALKAWRKTAKMVDIDHLEAGASFSHDTARECAENLIRLRGEGFVIPQRAIDALLSEDQSPC